MNSKKMDIDITSYLNYLKDQLFSDSNWKKITLNRNWTAGIPANPGVYAFKEGDKVVYVGETGNLRGRMNDLLDTRHHTIRRTLGQKLFYSIEGFKIATSRRKFPEHIEELLNNHICINLSIAYFEVSLGRKELEELIASEIDKTLILNKRGKRKSN